MFAVNTWEVKKINYFYLCSTIFKITQKKYDTFFLGYIAVILPKTETINPALEMIVVIRPIARNIHTYKTNRHTQIKKNRHSGRNIEN